MAGHREQRDQRDQRDQGKQCDQRNLRVGGGDTAERHQLREHRHRLGDPFRPASHGRPMRRAACRNVRAFAAAGIVV